MERNEINEFIEELKEENKFLKSQFDTFIQRETPAQEVTSKELSEQLEEIRWLSEPVKASVKNVASSETADGKTSTQNQEDEKSDI